jgi:hypothetical protein
MNVICVARESEKFFRTGLDWANQLELLDENRLCAHTPEALRA